MGRLDTLIKKILIENRRKRAGPVKINGLDGENNKFNGIYVLSDEDYNAMPMYVHKLNRNLILFSYFELGASKPYTFWRLTDSRTTGPDSKAGIYFNVGKLKAPENIVLYQGIVARDDDGKNSIVQHGAEIRRWDGDVPDVAVGIKREYDFYDNDNNNDNSESTSNRVKRENTATI